MGIFSRIFKIGQASANKALDSLEKPELMLDQAIRDKEKQIKEAKKAVQECIATERKTKTMFEQEKNEKANWESKAEAALRAGKEDLAMKAISRATEHENKAKSLETQWTSQRSSVDTLKQDIFKMEDELNEFKRNKDFIIAQSKASEVKKKIYEAKAKMGNDNSADDLMARMKAKAEKSALQAEAAKEMADSFDGKDSLEKEFESLDSSGASADVQAKLAALKGKIAQGN